MSKKNNFFQEGQLEEQLEVLVRSKDLTPNSRAYQRLKRFHSAWQKEEAQALDRVREKFVQRVSQQSEQTRFEIPPSDVPLPKPLSTLSVPSPRLLRARAVTSTLAAALLVSLLVSSFVLLLHTHTTSPSGVVPYSNKWHVVPSSPIPNSESGLMAISAATGSDAWAVGTTKDVSQLVQGKSVGQDMPSLPLVEYWNGQQWHIVATPHLSGQVSINAVVDIAPGDAWFVGSIANSAFIDSSTKAWPLIEHWDGRQWKVVSVLSAGSFENELSGIAALSPDDIWAVGHYTNTINPTLSNVLIEHWDGQQWKIASHPSAGSFENLQGITALSASDIWAVGSFRTTLSARFENLIEHWNGTQWQIISSPAPGLSENNLTSVTAVSANDIWAVGSYSNGNDYNYKTRSGSGFVMVNKSLVEHWNGQQWQVVAFPNLSPAGTDLGSVTSLGPNTIWVTGSIQKSDTINAQIGYWDGHKWHIRAQSTPGTLQNFAGIARDPAVPGKLWMVGSYGNNPPLGESQTLIETNE